LVLKELKNKILHRSIYSRLGLTLMVFLCITVTFAQTPDEGLGEISDEFQDCFFEALKQRGIENYEKAISTLLNCQEIDPQNSAVFFELGKNYLTLKNFQSAETSFLKAYETDSTNVWYAESLLDFYLQSNNPAAAVVYAEKLYENGRNHGETLARLYVDVGNLDKANETIQKLKIQNGNSHAVFQLETLVKELIRNEDNPEIDSAGSLPEKEEDFILALTNLLKANKTSNIIRLALGWREKSGNNQLTDAFLIPYFLEKKQWPDLENGVQSVFESKKLDAETRFMLLNQVIVFEQTHPEASEMVNKIVDLQEKSEFNLPLDKSLLDFLMNIKSEKAMVFANRILSVDETNFDALKFKITKLNQQKEYQQAVDLSLNALEFYPAQPEFYLESGKSFLGLNQAEKAIGQLLSGLDYIIDDLKMENDFYRQLALAYELTGDKPKETLYKNKIKETPQN
jgi:tetratricopeptide (TPR) repeat protein